MIWICYRGIDSKLKLGCRYPYTTPPYLYSSNYVEEMDLTGTISIGANTFHAPALCSFNQRLYVFWVNSKKDSEGQVIKYNRTDGTNTESGWLSNGTRTAQSSRTNQFKTSAMPAAISFGGLLYLAWLEEQPDTEDSEEYSINISTSSTGLSWTAPVKIVHSAAGAGGRPPAKFASSAYAPDFAVVDDVLYLFWGPLGAGANANGVVSVKIAGKNVPVRATDTTPYNNTGGEIPEYVLSAKWKTQRGNMLVSRPPPGAAFLFSVDRNNNVWVATDDYANRTNLGDQGIKSAFPPAGCLQYGMPGSRWGTKTRIALFWKNVSNNYLSACTIEIW